MLLGMSVPVMSNARSQSCYARLAACAMLIVSIFSATPGSATPLRGAPASLQGDLVRARGLWFDAVAYGADPTGRADSTAAIQATIDAAAAVDGVALLPAGVYLTTGGLHVPSDTSLVGAGAKRTSLVLTAAGNRDGILSEDESAPTHVIVSGLTFDTSRVPGVAAIRVPAERLERYTIEDCRFVNAAGSFEVRRATRMTSVRAPRS